MNQEFERFLNLLADNIAPSTEFMKNVKEEIHMHVFKPLQQRSRYSIARCEVLGGAGKDTSNRFKIDFDCVVYLNYETPPFKECLDDFENILLMNTNLQEADIKKTKFSLQFVLKLTNFVNREEVEIDLVLGANRVPQNVFTTLDQGRATLRAILKDSDSIESAVNNSGGLTELSVEFVKSQSQFARNLARLAKFWNMLKYPGITVSGRSTIMECLAIQSALEEENNCGNSNPSLFNAFRRFLDKVRNLNNTRLIFPEKLTFYGFHDIPKAIRDERPLLLDPSNPFNNFLGTRNLRRSENRKSFFSKFSEFARKSLEVCDQLGQALHPASVWLLFEPQPGYADFVSSANPSISVPRITDEYMGTYSLNIMNPSVTLRTESLGFFPHFYARVIGSLVAEVEIGCAQNDLSGVKKGMQQAIDRYQRRDDEWVTSTETHESRQLTVRIPLKKSPGYALVYSCSFK